METGVIHISYNCPYREYPKVCINLQTDVRWTYQFGGLFYGKKDTLQKVALLEMMGNYLKENKGKRLIAYDEREIKGFFEVIEKTQWSIKVHDCMFSERAEKWCFDDS